METSEFNFARDVSVLTKRPNPQNQRRKTFSVSMHEFLGLTQGQFKTVEIYDSNNRLKKTLTREEILSKAEITPLVNHVAEYAIYLVNYSELA